MDIIKIVITGGPCGGKSTGMEWIRKAFTEEQGWRVVIVPETATELIGGGVSPWTCGTNLDYQKCQMRLQLEKEDIFGQGVRTMDADRVLMVCDRGALDNKIYMNEEEYAEVLRFVGRDEQSLLDSYDAVFHLVTAADGAEAYYSLDNNGARYETPAQAVEMDRRGIRCWSSHRHLRIIDNSTGFDEKMERLIAEIRSFLDGRQAGSK